ncbi:carboxypeptidase-like regulatory domain-containing protein [Dyadobacter sandarakinus]|uniref:Carboxypeptidase-like regulatory domain-containing protein n=1 Tax=Dyadobacter sandarakinus TaxID=2747268 RepID=A0ABX7I6U2_9BACT|nr:carboxypeptidase-like regulatory domain-containing protein [Dyadobacter sandarakinus]
MQFRYILAFLIVLYCQSSFAQFLIKGKVTDTTSKQQLAGVNITAGSVGTATGANGGFELQSAGKIKELRVSYLGYVTQIVRVNDNDSFIEIPLAESSGQDLDEGRLPLST